LGIHEPFESVFILRSLNNTDLFIDVGANVGHYSLIASGVKRCKSIAIEPIPDTFAKLQRNLELNNLKNLVESKNLAVGKEKGKLYFSKDKGTMNKVVTDEYKKKLAIEVEKLDNILSDFKDYNQVFLKIDVEGYELHVFKGAKNVLRNPKVNVIICEINGSGNLYGVKDLEVYNELVSYGFKPFKYNLKYNAIEEIPQWNESQYNTIFIRDIASITDRLKSSNYLFST